MFDSRTAMHVFDAGTVTTQPNSNEVIGSHVRLSDPRLYFMGSNALLNRAQLVDDFLEKKTICRMDWPARSPDLNPLGMFRMI